MTKKNSNIVGEGKQQIKNNETDFAKDPLTDKIGNSLKRMYDDVVNQPVPDDFLNLLIEADKMSGQ